jgi:Fe-S cluster assembly protein SufD
VAFARDLVPLYRGQKARDPGAHDQICHRLEIVADDVKCAHGATVSRLQQNELFYLQSRGIAADQASRLLLRGYCDEVLRELPAAAASAHPLQLLLRERP